MSVQRDSAPLWLSHFNAGYGPDEIRAADVSCTLARGSLTALVGPNGAGKSTLLKGILGLTPVHDPNAVRFFGAPLDESRARVAYLPQRSEIDWNFPASALDVVTMGLYARIGILRRISGGAKSEARAALAAVGLAGIEGQPVGELSGGQRQRVLIARTLVQRADLLLLDEPFANVDEATERVISGILRGLSDGGTTVLAVHHDLGSVRANFDDAILFNGRLIAHGAAGAVLDEERIARAYGLPARAGSAA